MRLPKAIRVLSWAGDDWLPPEEKRRRLVPWPTLKRALDALNRAHRRGRRAVARAMAGRSS